MLGTGTNRSVKIGQSDLPPLDILCRYGDEHNRLGKRIDQAAGRLGIHLDRQIYCPAVHTTYAIAARSGASLTNHCVKVR